MILWDSLLHAVAISEWAGLAIQSLSLTFLGEAEVKVWAKNP